MIQRRTDDGDYYATCLEIPTLTVSEPTESKAIDTLRDCIRLSIEMMAENGEEAPRPKTFSENNGKILIRLPRSQHAALIAEAELEGVSLNQYLNSIVAARNSRHTYYNIVHPSSLEKTAIAVNRGEGVHAGQTAST